MMRVEFIRPIDRTVRALAAKAFGWYSVNFDVPHHVRVLVVPAPCIVDRNHGSGFGVFSTRTITVRDRRVRPMIGIAGHCPQGCEYEDWLQTLPETIFHEIAHYEQFRDGRKLQERGVAKRALALAIECFGTEPV